jgi:hypothetical protein
MANRYNDRRSGPEGSFWWYGWAGNVDDRVEQWATQMAAPYDWAANLFSNRGYDIIDVTDINGVTYKIPDPEYYRTSAQLMIGVTTDSFTGDFIGNSLTFGEFEFAHELAADGGAAAIEDWDNSYGRHTGTSDPNSVILGYWYATSAEGDGETVSAKVWDTFSDGIESPQIRMWRAPSNTGGSQRDGIFGLSYDDKEKAGLKSRFGFQGTLSGLDHRSVSAQMDSAIDELAKEIVTTKLSSQPIFNQIEINKGFNYNKRSFLSAEEEQQSGIASELSFVSASSTTNGGY